MPKRSTNDLVMSEEDVIVSLRPNPVGNKAQKWRDLEKAVAAGATTGDIYDRFGAGSGGLETVARYVRKGYYVIPGIPNYVKNPQKGDNPSANRQLAEQIRRLPRNTKIIVERPPSTRKVWEPKIDDVLERNPIISVRQICTKTGYSLEKVREYVNYLIDKGYAKRKADTPTDATMPKDAIASSPDNKALMPARRQITADQNFSGELSTDGDYIEGAVSQVRVNRYERDPKARAACLQKSGCNCSVCGFNFSKSYGEIGDGFIHVRHRKPLSLRKSQYRLNPASDLAPVCPNCHAMLHTSDPPLEIDELREIWQEHNCG